LNYTMTDKGDIIDDFIWLQMRRLNIR
jgi:hypothetical protein